MPTPEDNPRGTPLNASPPPLPPYVTVHSPDCPWRAWMVPYLTHAPDGPPSWLKGPPSCTCGAPPPCGVIEFSGGLVLGSCENVLGHDGPHSWEDEPWGRRAAHRSEDQPDVLPGRWYARLIISWPRAGIDPLPILHQIGSWALLDDPALEVDFNLTRDGLS